jgi:hypothetical protein
VGEHARNAKKQNNAAIHEGVESRGKRDDEESQLEDGGGGIVKRIRSQKHTFAFVWGFQKAEAGTGATAQSTKTTSKMGT